MLETIIIASPRGFCAGVERAIDVVEKTIELFGSPLYVYHRIVHNDHVVKRLEQKGAIFVDSIRDVPRYGRVIFSAHGIPPSVKEEAKQRGLKYIDATCPLVTKVHIEAAQYLKRGYDVLLVGHKEHQEVIGTAGICPLTLIENIEDVNKLQIDNNKIVYLTQTTLSVDDTIKIVMALKRKFPHIESPPKEDICYATQNRQDAVKKLAEKTELILVVGSKDSSNSNRLVETAINAGVKSYLINNSHDIFDSWLKNIKSVGITSGASVPETLVKGVIDVLKREGNPKLETLVTAEEHIQFVPPRELVQLTS